MTYSNTAGFGGVAMDGPYVMGMDFGTDSVRVLLLDAQTGQEVSSAVADYPRWSAGEYCNPDQRQYSQHPSDYLEAMKKAVKDTLQNLDGTAGRKVIGIAVDATGSTICAVDRHGCPLALEEEFADNPNAMFLLWKDNRAIEEAEEITEAATKWGKVNYLRYNGGVCSAEWFWPKILHILRHDQAVRENAFSWVELCDWVPAILTGNTDPLSMKRSRSASGHKALWQPEWGGLPPEDFLAAVDPLLEGVRKRLYEHTYTADTPAGTLSRRWAEELNLTGGIPVSVGTLDGHVGPLNVRLSPTTLFKTIGTSAVDLLIVEPFQVGNRAIGGLMGQVEGSVYPDRVTLEAGQGAFGDVFAWFNRILREYFTYSAEGGPSTSDVFRFLSEQAAQVPPTTDSPVILDWFSGRRTPNCNLHVKGAMARLSLKSTAGEIFRCLMESVAYGSRAIVENYLREGFVIDEVVVVGKLAHRNKLLMQILANVLNKPVKVVDCEEACARGAALLATVASGFYSSLSEAQSRLSSSFSATYHPEKDKARIYNKLYQDYLALGEFHEMNCS